MTYAGARDATAAQMAKVLRFPLEKKTMTNEQLAEMVKQNIAEPLELTRIEGIGAARIEKYGSDLLSVLDAPR